MALATLLRRAGRQRIRLTPSAGNAGGESLRGPQDWKSGDKLWVVEAIAPFGGAEEMVKDLKEKVFPTKPVHFLAVNKDGKQVRVM